MIFFLSKTVSERGSSYHNYLILNDL